MRSFAFLVSALVTSLAWTIYTFTIMMVYTNPVWPRAIVGGIAGILFGSLVAAGQYALLADRIPRPAKWFSLSILGWSVAGLLTALTCPLIAPGGLGNDFILGLALGGALVALLQWAALIHINVRPIPFIPATSAIWALAGFLSWKLYESLYRNNTLTPESITLPLLSNYTDTGFQQEIISGFAGALISGLVMGTLTSCLLVLTARAKHSAPSEPPPH